MPIEDRFNHLVSFPSYFLHESKKSTSTTRAVNVMVLNPNLTYEMVDEARNQSQEQTNFEESFRLLRIYLGDKVSTPIYFSAWRDFLIRNEKVKIFRIGTYNDSEIVNSIKQLSGEFEVEFTQDSGWKDVLECERNMALTLSKIRNGFYDTEIDEIIDRYRLNKMEQELVYELIYELFAKYEVSHLLYLNSQEHVAFSELSKVFVNSLLYGDFCTIEFEKVSVEMPDLAPPKAKVIKLNRTNFGKGVIVFSEQEIAELRLYNSAEAYNQIVGKIIKDVAQKGFSFSQQDFDNLLLSGDVAIKEFLVGFRGNSFCINLAKYNDIPENQPALNILANCRELKDENDRWIGSEYSSQTQLSALLKNSKYVDKTNLISITCEILQFLLAKNYGLLDDYSVFRRSSIEYTGIDWALIENRGVQEIRAVEWCGRPPASLMLVSQLDSRKKMYNLQQSKLVFYRSIKLNIDHKLFTSSDYLQNTRKFISFLNIPRPELNGANLKSKISIQGMLGVNEGELCMSTIFYIENNSEIDVIINLLNQFN